MNLKKGDSGDTVKALQLKLGLPVDGVFGAVTEAAVKQFQSRNGLVTDGIVGDKTWNKIMANAAPTTPTFKYSKEKIEKAVKSKGYQWFEDKLNIVGVRNSTTGKVVTNAFDDHITVSKKEGGVWKFYEWPNTTDPGRKGVMEYHNPNGVARMVPGQYIDSHGLGLHQGKYEALKQFKPVKVYRDANKDLTYDETKIQEGVFGINIHRAGVDSTLVENWSEGCQVFKTAAHFEAFMELCRSSGQKAFTYTLIESKDIV
jgi:peptidoglycan hydrolase-like protein with peptidoglycan-binding domain